MSKASVSQPSDTPPEATLPIKYHDLMLALSKARAARCLAECAGDADVRPTLPTRYEDRAKEVFEWMQSFAFDALDDALDEIEAAYRKERGEPGATEEAAA